MWNKSTRISGYIRRRFSAVVYGLIPLLNFRQAALSYIIPASPPAAIIPASGPRENFEPEVPRPVIGQQITTSMGEYARVDSDFYVARTRGLDQFLTVALEISGMNPAAKKSITTFVTFLPGERERLVAMEPILDALFAGDSEVFMRIMPSANGQRSGLTAYKSATVISWVKTP